MIGSMLGASVAAAFLLPQVVSPDDMQWVNKPLSPNFGLKWNAGFAAIPSQQHEFVWFGGINFITVFAETWVYDGEQWSEVNGNAPDARCHQYQSEFRDGVLLFGGEADVLNTDRRDDTWWFDGSTWSELNPATAPTARCCGTLTYDSVRDVAVLHGGVDQDLNWQTDTWEFDGTTWHLVATSGPPPRSNAGAAFDRERQVTVLFGGMDPNGGLLDDTWEWDGSQWSAVAVPGPSPRWAPAMAYQQELEQVILYGGESAGLDIQDDTWSFDGTEWTLLDVTGPEPRVEAHLAYDDSRGTLVLAGGFSFDTDDLTDTWELRCVTDATDLGFGKVASTNFYPEFTLCGRLNSGSRTELRVRKGPSNTFGFLLLSFTSQPQSAFGGTIVPATPLVFGPFDTDAEGALTFEFQGGLGLATDVYGQWLFDDPLASHGVGISNALEFSAFP